MHLCKKMSGKMLLLYSDLDKNGLIGNFDIDNWTETDVCYTTCMDVTKKGCQWVLQIYLAYWASAWHALVPDTHLVKIKSQKNNRPVSKQYGYFLTKLWGANRLSVALSFYMYDIMGLFICQFLSQFFTHSDMSFNITIPRR